MIDLHELANMPGAGNARIALMAHGKWNDHASDAVGLIPSCDFCGKYAPQVDKLVKSEIQFHMTGIVPAICSECISVCTEIMEAE